MIITSAAIILGLWCLVAMGGIVMITSYLYTVDRSVLHLLWLIPTILAMLLVMVLSLAYSIERVIRIADTLIK
jgi:hypothetical protein